MAYEPIEPPIELSPSVKDWLMGELRRVRDEVNQPKVQFILLDTLTAAPTKPREGLVVKADGTNWNPGSGAGVYVYKGGAWALLG